MKYNNETFLQYCEEHRVYVIGEYDNMKRETKIEGCTTTFIKSFRFMVEKGGAYCKECAIKRGAQKSKKMCIKKYGVEHSFQNKEVREKINII